MPGPGKLYQVGAVAQCPHGGTITAVSSMPRVKIMNAPATVATDMFTIVGCTFTLPNGKPQPCVKVQWTQPAARVTINRQPAVLSTSIGLCLSAEQAPQGPPSVKMTQIRTQGM